MTSPMKDDGDTPSVRSILYAFHERVIGTKANWQPDMQVEQLVKDLDAYVEAERAKAALEAKLFALDQVKVISTAPPYDGRMDFLNKCIDGWKAELKQGPTNAKEPEQAGVREKLTKVVLDYNSEYGRPEPTVDELLKAFEATCMEVMEAGRVDGMFIEWNGLNLADIGLMKEALAKLLGRGEEG